ncbi:MAG: ATP-dependent helicase [Theionarchaea archaeon]|nr:ATP-dependent helicase [Theionarchaea archaeon]
MKKFTQTDRTVMELFEEYMREWVLATFDTLTPPQREAWPFIARKKNTLIFSPTGSGKTLAAFLFCINELFKRSINNDLEDTIYVLYISPLRALSNDIHRNLYQPLRGILKILKEKSIHCQPIRARVRTGDTTSKERAQMARKPPHILITTPETLYIILTTKKFRENLKNIEYVIVDEIHALAGSKRGVQLSLSLERLTSFLGYNPVRIGLSATQSPVEEIAKFLTGMNADGTSRPCEIVTIGARKHLDLQVVSPVDNLLEAKNDVIWNSAYLKLIEMIEAHETTLIFTNSRYRTEHMALHLREIGEEHGLSIGSHHGSMSRLIRQNLEENLKSNKLDAVVATSSLELGIDIGNIDLVCNVESPKSLSSGMQRIGRAGHLLKETSKGRIVAVDPDDLAESAVLVKGIADGQIDTTTISFNALDILAQQIVACAAADEWDTDELYTMVRKSYCYHDLSRKDFDKTMDMLSSQISRKVYPKIYYDRVNKKITGARGARNICFRCGGAIPDVSHYHVYSDTSKIGVLDEGFVERIRPGDVFILGSQAWQLTGLDKKKVFVQRVSGVPPTIPYWGGARPSRTYDLGLLVGRFKREMQKWIASTTVEAWLQKEYLLDVNGAAALAKYYREQYMILGILPSDTCIVVESFKNELGQTQIAVHSPFGVRINDLWGYALLVAVQKIFHVQAHVATVDDGILLTFPEGVHLSPEEVFHAVDTVFLEENMEDILMNSPIFTSRFRHCAVRSFLILREYAGKKTPVWLQSLKAAELLDELRNDKNFPIVKEALRESAEEAFDLPHLMEILEKIEKKKIDVSFYETRTPSPFIHQLLLVGQCGDFGRISNEERKLRLIHLHRQVLKQLIDEDLIKGLLVEEEVIAVERELQFLLISQKARSEDELARIVQALQDVTTEEIKERVLHPDKAKSLLEQLCNKKRIVQVRIPFAVPEQRWIPTELFNVYKAAFVRHTKEQFAGIMKGLHAFRLVGILTRGEIVYVDEEWIPQELRSEKDRISSQAAVIKNFLMHHGPVTKYELMERYGLPSEAITEVLEQLEEQGLVSEGSFVGTKDSPQWCWKKTLEELHRRSLRSLKEQVKPLSPDRYVDFMLKWQHVHPETQLQGKEGVYKAVRQLQTWEEHTTCWERYLLATRVSDYTPEMVDDLIAEKKISFGRFNPLPDHVLYELPNRGAIQLYCTEDFSFVVNTNSRDYFEDIKAECEEIIEVLRLDIWPSLSFEGIVTGTQMDRNRVCRAVLRLFQLGMLENDSYDSVRQCTIMSGMSAAWDLTHSPEEVDGKQICTNIKRKGIHVEKGRWALTKEGNARTLDRVRQIFYRYGVVTRDTVKNEPITPQEFAQGCRVLLLRGEIREGRFIEGLDGIQYALPEAVDFLRKVEPDEAMVVVNMKDPANVCGQLFPIIDEAGNVIKHTAAVANHVVIQKGIVIAIVTTKNYPHRYCNVELKILHNLSVKEMMELIKKVVAYGKQSGVQKRFKAIRMVSFNEQPLPGTGVDRILKACGFTHGENGFVLPMDKPLKDVSRENLDIPLIFERFREVESQIVTA